MSSRAPRCAYAALAALALAATSLRGAAASTASAATATTATAGGTGARAAAVAGRWEAADPTAGDRRPLLGIDLADAGRRPTRAELVALRDLGAAAVRVDVRWDLAEPRRGARRWAELDAFAEAARAAGLPWVARLHASPAWSRRDAPPPAHWWLCRDERPESVADAAAAPPSDPRDLAAFAVDLAARWPVGPTAIEVWREPNLMPNWREGGPDPEDYARLLGAVASAVRAVPGGPRVVSAALAPTTELHPCAMDDVVFLGRVARAGGLRDVDAIGIAPLGMDAGPDAAADPDALGVGRAELLHRAVTRAGVDAPLWALSFGWDSARTANAADASGAEPEPRGALPPDDAAAALRVAWRRAAGDWPWLDAAFVRGVGLAGVSEPGSQRLTLGGGAPTPLERAIADLADAGAAPGDPPRPSRAIDPRDGSSRGAAMSRVWPRPTSTALVALALLLGGAAALGLRGRAAPLMARALEAARRVSAPASAAAYGAAIALVWLAAPCVPEAVCTGLRWPLGVPGVAVLAWLAAARPTLATSAVAAAAPLAYAGRLALGPVPVANVELLVALAAWGRLAAWYAGTEPPARRPVRGLDAAVAVLVAWAALGPAWAPRPGLALREWRTVILEPAVLYALLRTAPDARSAARWALGGLAAGGTVAAAVGLGQVVLGGLGLSAGGIAAEGVIRARGPYGSPNNLALMLGRVTMLLGAAALAPHASRDARRAARAALPVVAAGLLATFSRGAVLFGIPAGAGAVALRLASRAHRRRAAMGLALALGATLLALAPFAGSERVAGALRLSPGSTGYYRVQLWRSAARMIADHPLLGVGPDGFLYAYREVYVARDVIQERFLSHPHNLVLDAWTRLGLPGLIVLVWVAAGTLRLARRLASEGRRGAVVAGALGMQAYAAAHGLVDHAFFLVDLAVATWVAQAALLAEDEAEPAPCVEGEIAGMPAGRSGPTRI